MVKRYTGSNQEADIEAFLQSSLPHLALPEHRGQFTIGKLYMGEQYAIDNRIKFTTGSTGFELQELTSRGPSGYLTATGRIQQDGDHWKLAANASIVARKHSKSIGEQVLAIDWRWHSGDIDISSEGESWGELLDSSRGKLQLAGTHHAAQPTPVTVSAVLGRQQAAFTLQDMDIHLGDSHITGQLEFPGDKERKLVMELQAEALDLNFLFQVSEAADTPGIALPTFLGLYQGVELDWDFEFKNVSLPGINLSDAGIDLQRNSEGGHFNILARGHQGGEIDSRLLWKSPPQSPDSVTLGITLREMDLARFFQQQQGLLHARTSGKIEFSSQGKGVEHIFESMRGHADITTDLRSDNNWERPPEADEQVKLSGDAALVVEKQQILGLRIDQLKVASFEQDITGRISLVTGREPWLRARLESHQLNITHLLELIPESEAEADRIDLLNSLRILGAFRLYINADTVQFGGEEFSQVLLDIASDQDLIEINHLDFSLKNGTANSSARLVWKDDRASLSAKGEIDQLVLDHFAQRLALDSAVPLQGSFKLAGQGGSVEEIATNLSGNIDLQAATAPVTPDQRRQLQLELQKIPHGVQADVQSFILGSSELQGSVRYTRPDTGRPLLELDLDGGQLSLARWENTGPVTTTKTDDDGFLSRTASASSKAVHEVLSAPAKLLGEAEPEDATEPPTAHRIFDEQPLTLGFLRKYDLQLQGKLDSLTSRVVHARGVDFDISNTGGDFAIQASADYLNSGTAEMTLSYDLRQTPPPASLTATVEGIFQKPEDTVSSRTAFIALTSQGDSQALLANNINGEVYLSLGKGPLDYGGVSFLTANAARAMFTTLIPGTQSKTPELQCAVTMAIFKDGTGVTPYGYAGQTRRANLLGRVEVELAEETIRVEFNSRSREGAGLSLGNMFSNSVRIQGPLDNPVIVPNTTSILWRGWAAFATAGLSMVGEGVLNRTLAGKDPCGDILEEIRKETCAGNSPAAASSLVCPAAPTQN